MVLRSINFATILGHLYHFVFKVTPKNKSYIITQWHLCRKAQKLALKVQCLLQNHFSQL